MKESVDVPAPWNLTDKLDEIMQMYFAILLFGARKSMDYISNKRFKETLWTVFTMTALALAVFSLDGYNFTDYIWLVITGGTGCLLLFEILTQRSLEKTIMILAEDARDCKNRLKELTEANIDDMKMLLDRVQDDKLRDLIKRFLDTDDWL